MLKESAMRKEEGTLTICLPFQLRKEGKYYVSWCPILDVSSQGETPTKAIKNLREAIGLFLTSCIDRGTLSDVLKDCGFTAYPIKPTSSSKRPRANEISVPLPFVFEKQLAKCQG